MSIFEDWTEREIKALNRATALLRAKQLPARDKRREKRKTIYEQKRKPNEK